MNRILKVSLIQMHTIPQDLERNINLALKMAKKSVKNGAKLIVLPELFDSGYCVEKESEKYASDFTNLKSSKTLQSLLIFCQKYKVYIIGCVIEKDSKKNAFYDTAFILGENGLVGKYRKIYLWGDEPKRFAGGSEYPVFTLKFKTFQVKVGLQICYEIGFSEGARILSLKGAEILVFPSAFGKARTYAWNLASRARALENGTFVLAVNQSKSQSNQFTHQKLKFAANSQIINPRGEVLAKAKKDNEALICVLNLQECKEQRNALPYLKDLNISLQTKALQSLKRSFESE
ncbi:carbon-nitrogen hydrolase family protein [uncultured Helicobacter sp.]|uniref:carbon-nitrogen hydrolase family protein n=1 Tax=uncultured Helicobacter sp. TaxID=175537 RepID=UPI002634085D|nr:carbon-nitrogen hydrolase family protein [uncultured Helicobacter sp.]